MRYRVAKRDTGANHHAKWNNPELLLVRTTVVNLALHALVGKLLETGALDMADIVE